MAKKKSRGAETDSSAAPPRIDVGAAPKPYVVLARKYRPQTFDDLIGQEAMVQTLRNAIASGRIAHGYMLTGVRGVGKTTTARILARALNYETGEISTPTIEMPALGRHCAEIMESRHPDVIEMDAASNTGVDNMREIIESARYKPIIARTKVFIIDEVHMLSKGAFNALLKTLEEPPPHVRFIFATTEIRKVPVTVLSRCQRFDLRRVDVPRLVEHLRTVVAKEEASADDDALALIARAAEGSVRDALSILDQAIATSLGPEGLGKVTAGSVAAMLGLADRGRIFDLLECLLSGEASRALENLSALHRDGGDPVQILADLAEAVHLAARTKIAGPETAGEGLSAEEKRRASTVGTKLSVAVLARCWQMILKGLEDAGKAPDPLAAAEMVLIRIAYAADLPPPDEIIRALGEAAGRAPNMSVGSTPAPGPATTASSVGSGEVLGHAHVAPASHHPEAETESDAPDAALGFDLDYAEGDPSLLSHDPRVAPLKSFLDVIRLAATRRDAKLTVHLEEHVSLVRFDAGARAIDIFLLPGAPPEIANQLREKLNAWTGQRWVVVLSKAPGDPPAGEARRAREAAELAALRKHPAVAAVLEQFPDAEIAAVRPLSGSQDDDSATG